MSDRFMRLPEVIEMTALRRSTLYRMISESRFPRPVLLGERAVAWRLSEIEAWMASPTTWNGK